MRFYFAWVAPTETVFNSSHKREDAAIYDFNLQQTEGDFATLELTIDNPRVGLLNQARKIWAWFAYEHPTAGTIPLFFGRLVGVPDDIEGTTLKINFIARPEDYDAQKLAVAEALAVAPYWDPIWFDATKPFDPDNVLEFRPELWHIDPVTHVVSSSNIIEGEDGGFVLGEADIFWDSVHIRYGQPPVRAVSMLATVSWDQKGTGTLDVTDRILGSARLIESYTGEGLQKAWPEAGKSLGGGWAVSSSFCNPVFYKSPQTLFEPGYEIVESERTNGKPYEYFQYDALFNPHGGLVFVKWSLSVGLTLGFDVTRRRSEKLTFTLEADVQSVVTDPLGQDVLQLTMQSSELNQPIDPGGTMPIVDERRASFFSTDRGTQALESLLAIARAKMLARARCVEVELELPFQDAIALGISLRKNVIMTDHRLPGGLATGKLTHYSFKLSGDDGQPTCTLNFSSTVGQGNSVVAVTGSPDYVEDDYVEDPYQIHIGRYILPALGDVVYMPILGTPPNDDGIDLFRMSALKAVTALTITNPASVQEVAFPLHSAPTALQPAGTWSQYYLTEAALIGYPGFMGGSIRPDYDPAAAISDLNTNHKTQIELHLLDISSGPFETDYTVNVSDLVMPRLIDLEAST